MVVKKFLRQPRGAPSALDGHVYTDVVSCRYAAYTYREQRILILESSRPLRPQSVHRGRMTSRSTCLRGGRTSDPRSEPAIPSGSTGHNGRSVGGNPAAESRRGGKVVLVEADKIRLSD